MQLSGPCITIARGNSVLVLPWPQNLFAVELSRIRVMKYRSGGWKVLGSTRNGRRIVGNTNRCPVQADSKLHYCEGLGDIQVLIILCGKKNELLRFPGRAAFKVSIYVPSWSDPQWMLRMPSIVMSTASTMLQAAVGWRCGRQLSHTKWRNHRNLRSCTPLTVEASRWCE